MIRVSISFLIFSAIIAVPPLVLSYMGHAELLDPAFWKMFGFFFLVTTLVCGTVIFGQQKNDKMGVQLFLAATTIKLLACMIFVLIYLHKKPHNSLHFVFSFFYLYLVNTGFEIYGLLCNLRDQNGK
ncbi:hypothetical protein C8P68_106294 [Mucilaginibacter yixingensis]|uniref:Uncharacterized protein n=1 Tax=Mucilaginibacter yixingensis TaxID=1295612 RepID=A0A2T5J7J5_9SPHI|nr:hypothetical protein C8P68_106294 [Mucilaginibacter yixingensis]